MIGVGRGSPVETAGGEVRSRGKGCVLGGGELARTVTFVGEMAGLEMLLAKDALRGVGGVCRVCDASCSLSC